MFGAVSVALFSVVIVSSSAVVRAVASSPVLIGIVGVFSVLVVESAVVVRIKVAIPPAK